MADNEHTTRRAARIRWTVLVSFVARILQYATSFLSVRLAIGYLGAESYGVWITLSTTLAWVLLLDFGVGNGLRNMLSQAYGQDDRVKAQQYVSTVFWFLSGVGLILVLLMGIMFFVTPWSLVFNVGPSVNTSELNLAVGVVLVIVALRLPLSIVNITYSAHQEGYIAAIWEIIGAVGSLAVLFLVIQFEGGLPLLAIALSGVPLLVTIVNAFYLFGVEKPWLCPKFHMFDRLSMRSVLNLGTKFAIIQLSVLIVYQTDNIVISQVMGPAAVTPFNLAMRIVLLFTAMQSLYLAPLWPAYAEAIARGDLRWVRAWLVQSAILSICAGTVTAVGLVVGGRALIYAWTGVSDALPSQSLLLWLGAWCFLYFWQSPFAIFLNGISSISLMSKIALLGAPLNLIMCIVLGQRFGLEGIAAANVMTLLIGAIQAPVESFVRLKRLIAPRTL